MHCWILNITLHKINDETMKQASILIVDDDADLREILQFNLESIGYVVETAASGEEALTMIARRFNLILLDVMMGGMSGFQVAATLRRNGNAVPIIFLTAKDTENDMLTGFSVGGDDYIAKPFSIKEVLARVQSVLKRTMPAEESTQRRVAKGLVVDLAARQVYVDSMPVNLTKTEYDILCLLADHPGQALTRADILQRIWKGGVVLERTIDVHITRIRHKLGHCGSYITNRPGYGYTFNP